MNKRFEVGMSVKVNGEIGKIIEDRLGQIATNRGANVEFEDGSFFWFFEEKIEIIGKTIQGGTNNMGKKLVFRFTTETSMSEEEEVKYFEDMTKEDFESEKADAIEDIERVMGAKVSSCDIRIVEEKELNNVDYTPDKISIGMFDETEGVHIHVKGKPGEQEVDVVSDMNSNDMANLFMAILQNMVEGGGK